MKNNQARENAPKTLIPSKRRPVPGIAVAVCACAVIFLVAAWATGFSSNRSPLAFLFISVLVFLFLTALYIREYRKSQRLSTPLSLMTDTTRGCYWEINPVTQKIGLTPSGHTLFGRDVHTVDELAALIHPDDAGLFRKAVGGVFLPDGKLETEFRIQSVMGHWRWFAMRSSVVERASDGSAGRALGSMMDIDDHRRAVEGMRASEKRLSTIFRSAPGSMAVTDDEGRLIDANQAFYDMLGYSAEELQGVSIMSLSETPRDRDNKTLMSEILRECESYEDNRFRLEENFVCRDGRRIILDFGLSAILDYDGNVQNYIFSGMDITREKKRAAELKLLAENQRWIFDFLRRFTQFNGIEQLFLALRENLPKVVAFTALKLVVPSFLNRSRVMDTAAQTTDATQLEEEIAGVLAGSGPLGRSYVARVAVVDTTSDGASILAVPLAYKETAWGVISLKNTGPSGFSEQDVTLMNIVGSNIALYLEELANRAELDTHAERLQELHSLIHTLLRTRNRDHLLEGMLGYLKNAVPDSACAVYLYSGDKNGAESGLERLAWYDGESVSVPDSTSVLNAIAHETSRSEYGENDLEIRRIFPISFQTRNVGAVDLYKPSGLQPAEQKMYQLLVDYVAGFWMLYDLMNLREEEASVDPLTGIWNRRYMIRRLEEESDRICRYGGNACIVIGDMGNFKHINDNYGHVKGDEVLIRVAAGLKKNLRLSDSLGRYGGDEFIFLLPNITKEDAALVLERMRLELSQLRIISDDSNPESPMVTIIMDFGLALFPGGAATLMDTINLADEAMYANKIARKEQTSKMTAAETGCPPREKEREKEDSAKKNRAEEYNPDEEDSEADDETWNRHRKKTRNGKTNGKRSKDDDEENI